MAEEEKEPEKRLAWGYYTRNDAFVKERFLAKDYDRATACGLGNFDRLFAFFCQMDLFSLFDFRPKARQRIMIPTALLLSTYSAKIICEMNSLNQVDMQLFKDRALLEMIGFTGVQIAEGFSKRSKGRHLPFNISTLGKLMPDFSPKAKPKPEIFVAAILVPLNESENKYLLPLLKQASQEYRVG